MHELTEKWAKQSAALRESYREHVLNILNAEIHANKLFSFRFLFPSPECRGTAVNVLRQLLIDGKIVAARSNDRKTYYGLPGVSGLISLVKCFMHELTEKWAKQSAALRESYREHVLNILNAEIHANKLFSFRSLFPNPECRGTAVNVLRQLLIDGKIVAARSNDRKTYYGLPGVSGLISLVK